MLVHNAKASAEWYREKLGFEILSAEGHAVFVKPKGSSSPLLHLCERCADWGDDRPGGRTGVWLRCGEMVVHRDARTGRAAPASHPEDVERTYLELKEKGVPFSEELVATDWGRMAVLRDLDGNEFEIS